MRNKSHVSELNTSEDKRKLMELALKGQKRFKIWCEQHDIDYEKLSDDEVMEMINETIAKHRGGRKGGKGRKKDIPSLTSIPSFPEMIKVITTKHKNFWGGQ